MKINFLLQWTVFATVSATSLSASAIQVTSSQFGASWPLTVQYGELSCYPINGAGNAQAVVFKTPQNTYAINGTASSHAKTKGWQDVRPIWRDNPEILGTKIPITALINRGLELCK